MKIVKNGKIYNTSTSTEIFYKGVDETGWMYYRTEKGSYYKVLDEVNELQTLTETEVMDDYLNMVGIENFADDAEVLEKLKNLEGYVETLTEA
jgi:hypothetical protein